MLMPNRVALVIMVLLCIANARTIAAADPATPSASPRVLQEVLRAPSPLDGAQAARLDAYLPQASAIDVGSVPLRLKLAELAAEQAGLSQFTGSKRIVGGSDVMPHEARWQVALVVPATPPASGQFCGGSIIAPNWILTAAHCVDSTSASQFQIFSGSRDLDSTGQVATVSRVLKHPKWNAADNSMRNDIALVKLSQALIMEPGKREIVAIPQLVTTPSAAPGALAVVTGWGATSEGGVGSRRLRKVVVPIVDKTQCNAADHYNGDIAEGMMCAGIGGKDSCQGDSGGPLVDSLAATQPLQLGVVSWGYGCARINKPGVYTDVATYADWIRETISKN